MHIAVVQGQFEDLPVLDIVSQSRVLSVDLDVARGNLDHHGFLDLADFQRLRHLSEAADLGMDPGHHTFPEPLGFNLHFVLARRDRTQKSSSPVELVACVLDRFVCRFVMVTVAPATVAPEGSVIVPLIVEVPNCPQTQVPDRRRIINRTGKRNFIVDHFIDGSFRAIIH